MREGECRIDIGLFLNEYSRWELGTPHQSVILHEMFLHVAERGQKEAEHMVCWGCQGSASEPNPQSTRTTPVSTPEEEATMGTAKESIVEKRPQSNSLIGKRCYLPPDPWWPLGRSPICQEV